MLKGTTELVHPWGNVSILSTCFTCSLKELSVVSSLGRTTEPWKVNIHKAAKPLLICLYNPLHWLHAAYKAFQYITMLLTESSSIGSINFFHFQKSLVKSELGTDIRLITHRTSKRVTKASLYHSLSVTQRDHLPKKEGIGLFLTPWHHHRSGQLLPQGRSSPNSSLTWVQSSWPRRWKHLSPCSSFSNICSRCPYLGTQTGDTNTPH